MKMYYKLWMIAVVLFWMPVFASAQPGSDWEAIVFNHAGAQLIRVGATGAQLSTHQLPLPPSSSLSTHVSVSPSGNLVAYTAYNPNLVYLNIYNLAFDQVITSPIITPPNFIDSTTSLDYSNRLVSWSDDETRFALGILIDNNWAIRIYDTANGNLISEIIGGDPRIPDPAQGLMPLPLYMTNDSVSFALLLVNAGGAPEYSSYQWNFVTQDVVTDARVRTIIHDVFERTGEVILTVSDYSLPNQSALIQGPGEQNNTLQVGFPNSTITQPVIVEPDYSLSSPRFIQNGELIATFSTNMFTSDNRWDVYDRGGAWLGSLQIGDFVPQMMGISDGFVYTANMSDIAMVNPTVNSLPNTSALVYVNTRDGFVNDVGQLIWTAPMGESPRLVWVADPRSNLLSLPTMPWANIGISIGDYLSGVPLPTVSPPVATPSGAFLIGGVAEINTTAGDRANMRQDAGVNFPVVEPLADGAQVQIIGGPIDDGTFTWWQVRTLSGNQGWVVQSAEGVQVLIPLATGSSSAPTALPPVASGILQVGIRAFVTSQGDNINMRDASNTSAPVVRILPSGTTFDIIGGGFSNEGYTWWQISYDNIIGWVAEGTLTEDWIAPLSP